jgi:catechol 2,3-dioxygenase-like lactoylglutathione lyase family enzyme
MSSRPIAFQPLAPALLCADMRVSLAFYCDLLGFQLLGGPGYPFFVYVEREHAQIRLEQYDPEFSSLAGALERPFGRGVNLQIQVADFAPLLDVLAGANWPLYKELLEVWDRNGDQLQGQYEFVVQDPDGYLLRFCQGLGAHPYQDGAVI